MSGNPTKSIRDSRPYAPMGSDHGDAFHYMGRTQTRVSRDVRSRPPLLVAYEPR